MLSLKSECVDRMIFFGEAPLRKALAEFESHYHEERNHQGLENLLIDPGDDVGNTTGNIECRGNGSVDSCGTTTDELPETPLRETGIAVPLLLLQANESDSLYLTTQTG